MLTPSCVTNIRSSSITLVIESYGIKLSRHGAACCPFHNEKTPSFHVSEKKGIYKCFGCGVGGDVLQFVMERDRLEFLEAAEKVASLCGVPLEYDAKSDRQAYIQAREKKATLRPVLTEAHEIYRELLWKNPDALAYLKNRQMTDEMIAFWGLGYAPFNGRTLADSFARDGKLPAAYELGLCRERDNERAYDMYRSRIIIPILNAQGEIISLGGRLIELPGDEKTDGKISKYINGSLSMLYDKSKTLFGLYQATKGIAREGFAILTEGYFDVISMHHAGADNTVATCGTALTEDHCRLLKKYTSRVVIMRDGDKAGIMAAEKDMKMLLSANFRTEIYPLENGDPDDLARSYYGELETEQIDPFAE